MDILALVKAGRQAEVFATLRPRSDAGDAMASANLSVVHGLLGDRPQQIFYALRAFEQDGHAPASLQAMFRALQMTDNFRALGNLYSALSDQRSLSRAHRLMGAVALMISNRPDEAAAAAALAGEFPHETLEELRLAYILARGRLAHEEVMGILDRLERLGEPVAILRVNQCFEAGDMAGAIAWFEQTGTDDPGSGKLALLAAVSLGDRERVARLAQAVPLPAGAAAIAQGFLEGWEEVQVRGAERSYRFPFAPTNLSVALAHATGEFYEAGALALCRRFVGPDAVVVDVGANIGNHATYYAGEAGCRVLAFECNPRMVGLLRQGVEMNGLGERIDLTHLGKAVSDRVGEVRFNVVRDDYSYLDDSEAAAPTPAITLDSLDLPRCDLLKIDVDGGEPKVLAGARRLLNTLRPVVTIEVLNFNRAEVLQRLAYYGYEVLREDSRQSAYSDFIFVPAESPHRSL